FALPDLPARPVIGFFPGSTIGNFHPAEARSFLSRALTSLGAESLLLIGVDLVKHREILEAAYTDAAGITAAFNLSLLTRINRELDGHFNPGAFRHVAVFNAALSRIEMHLESTRPQIVRIANMVVHFAESEWIHTENSYKYTVLGFQHLARK